MVGTILSVQPDLKQVQTWNGRYHTIRSARSETSTDMKWSVPYYPFSQIWNKYRHEMVGTILSVQPDLKQVQTWNGRYHTIRSARSETSTDMKWSVPYYPFSQIWNKYRHEPKPTRRDWSSKKKTQKEAFRMKGALRNAKQSKTTNNNSLVEEGQRKGLKTKLFYWKGALREAVGRRRPEIKS